MTVFAAASLAEAFTEIGNQFEVDNPKVHLVFNFAGSQQLSQQLAQGAAADVFASADQAQMNAAIQAGRVAEGSQKLFASNRLIVLFLKVGSIELNQLQDLAKPGLRLVLAAEAVPVGRYTLQFLDRAAQDEALGVDFKERVLKNVVSYEENVRAVLAKVTLGEADAGIVYTSDIVGYDAIRYLEIPAELNPITTYPIAAIADSAHPEPAQAFVDFVLSDTGQSILANYGFLPVDS